MKTSEEVANILRNNNFREFIITNIDSCLQVEIKFKRCTLYLCIDDDGVCLGNSDLELDFVKGNNDELDLMKSILNAISDILK